LLVFSHLWKMGENVIKVKEEIEGDKKVAEG
jgi:hypothetical protein